MGFSGALALGWSKPRAGQQNFGEWRAQQRLGNHAQSVHAWRWPTRSHSPKPSTPVCGWWRLTAATLI